MCLLYHLTLHLDCISLNQPVLYGISLFSGKRVTMTFRTYIQFSTLTFNTTCIREPTVPALVECIGCMGNTRLHWRTNNVSPWFWLHWNLFACTWEPTVSALGVYIGECTLAQCLHYSWPTLQDLTLCFSHVHTSLDNPPSSTSLLRLTVASYATRPRMCVSHSVTKS